MKDGELAANLREFGEALRKGNNSVAMDLLDRTIRMAGDSGDPEMLPRLRAFQSELRTKFIRIDFGPDSDEGMVGEPGGPLAGNDQGSVQHLNHQNDFHNHAP